MFAEDAAGAMVTAVRLLQYEDMLPSEDISCLLSLTSAGCKAFATCSRAFMKLESLSAVSYKDTSTVSVKLDGL